jgi:hypothetical protein
MPHASNINKLKFTEKYSVQIMLGQRNKNKGRNRGQPATYAPLWKVVKKKEMADITDTAGSLSHKLDKSN